MGILDGMLIENKSGVRRILACHFWLASLYELVGAACEICCNKLEMRKRREIVENF